MLIAMEVRSMSTFGVFQRSISNRILLRKVNFASMTMIPNPSLDCSCVVLNFWPNLSLVFLIKLFL